MNEYATYETDGFEFEFESESESEESSEISDELLSVSEAPRPAGGCRCHRRRSAGELDEADQESPVASPGTAAPSWLNPLVRLYRAGSLGWKAGRFIDKQSGKMFGKPISTAGANFLYRRLGRSRGLEDFFDNLPPRVKRWLNQF